MAKVAIGVFQEYLRSLNEETGNVDRLQAALDAADISVDHVLGRGPVQVAGSATARVYRVPNDRCSTLYIDDCTTVTAVSEDGTALTTGDYQKEPLNLMVRGEARPYHRLIRLGGASWAFDGPRALLSVTGTWGWVTVSAPIIEATKMLAKDIAMSRELRGDIAGFTEFGAVRIRQSPQIMGLLAPYVASWAVA